MSELSRQVLKPEVLRTSVQRTLAGRASRSKRGRMVSRSARRILIVAITGGEGGEDCTPSGSGRELLC